MAVATHKCQGISKTTSGRSWNFLDSNPWNDAVLGRFHRQRFVLKSALQKSTEALLNDQKNMKSTRKPQFSGPFGAFWVF